MKLYKRAAALILTAATLLSLAPPVSAEGDRVTISSAKEFYALVQNCTRDVWSQRVTVELTADLDLSGSDFQPIPIFQGTFHGNGHTIRGITYDHKGSTLGLFRTLTESAVVEGLCVEGLLEPQGSASWACLPAKITAPSAPAPPKGPSPARRTWAAWWESMERPAASKAPPARSRSPV